MAAAVTDYRQLSLWFDTLPEPVVPRAPLTGDTTADVAIVGAGFTGLWTAYYLLAADPSLRVVVLESEVAAAVDLITDALLPGRVGEVRRPTERELAATLVLAMPITQWSLKVSDGWPEDPPVDVAGDAWAGVVPLAPRFGEPMAAPDLRAGIPVPPSVRALS